MWIFEKQVCSLGGRAEYFTDTLSAYPACNMGKSGELQYLGFVPVLSLLFSGRSMPTLCTWSYASRYGGSCKHFSMQ